MQLRSSATGPTVLAILLLCAGPDAAAQDTKPTPETRPAPEKRPTPETRPAPEAESAQDARNAWVTPAVNAPRLMYRTFPSRAAGTPVSYHVYVPEIYDRAKERRFPVLYWLHGSGGGARGLPWLARHFDAAIGSGKTPPMLVVFPNGRRLSLWVDSKDGSVPMEEIFMKELIPHIDATWRTRASRESRLIEGFSMGGYGAARLAFKYPEVIAAASILSGGPLQKEFTHAPRAGQRKREIVLKRVFGGDHEYFKALSPWVLAETNADSIRDKLRLRLVIGEKDEMLDVIKAFEKHLNRLKIPHIFRLVPRVGHDPKAVLEAIDEESWDFYRSAFGKPSATHDVERALETPAGKGR